MESSSESLLCARFSSSNLLTTSSSRKKSFVDFSDLYNSGYELSYQNPANIANFNSYKPDNIEIDAVPSSLPTSMSMNSTSASQISPASSISSVTFFSGDRPALTSLIVPNMTSYSTGETNFVSGTHQRSLKQVSHNTVQPHLSSANPCNPSATNCRSHQRETSNTTAAMSVVCPHATHLTGVQRQATDNPESSATTRLCPSAQSLGVKKSSAKVSQGSPTTVPSSSTLDMAIKSGDRTVYIYNMDLKHSGVQIGNNNVMRVTTCQQNPQKKCRTKSSSKVTRKKIEVADREVNEKELNSISGKIGKDWSALGRQLDITDSDLETIRYDHRSESVREVAYQMLRDWHERLGKDATLLILAKALVAIERGDIAQKLSEL